MRRLALLALVALVASACADPKCPCNTGGGAASPTTPSAPAVTFTTYSDADLQACVDQTSAYRALVGLPALARSSTLEAFAKTGAQQDGTAHTAHQHITQNQPIGVGENEMPWWPVAQFQSVSAVLAYGLSVMWAEGPSGGHYQNITRTQFTTLGCGIYIANGEITVTQDFK